MSGHSEANKQVRHTPRGLARFVRACRALLPTLWCLAIGLVLSAHPGCDGCFGGLPDDMDQGSSDWTGNRAPILAPVGTRTIEEGALLQVILSVYDPDNDPLEFRAGPLPEGAEFDRQHGVFSWVPPQGSAENSPFTVEFGASDGQLEATATGSFIVEAGPVYMYDLQPERIPQRGGVLVTVEGVGFTGPAAATIAGIYALDIHVISDTTLTFVSPPLPGVFGPETLTLLFTSDRRLVVRNAVFVFAEDVELTGRVSRFPLPPGISAWCAADIDGDLADEIVAGTDQAVFVVDPGAGIPSIEPLVDEGADDIQAGHLDGDSLADLVVRTPEGEVWAMMGASADTPMIVHEAWNPARSLVLFDLEGDGDDDILVIDDQGTRLVYASNGGAIVEEPIRSPGLALPLRAQVVDLEGDPSGDLLLDLLDGFAVALGVETGAFLDDRAVAGSAGFRAPAVQSNDIDGRYDIVALGEDTLGVFRPDSRGEWKLALEMALPPLDRLQSSRHLVDVDGDGVTEVLTLPAGVFGFRLEQRSGGIYETAGWTMVGEVVGPPLVADLDADGVAELLLLDAQGEQGVALGMRPGGRLPAAPRGVRTSGGLAVMAGDYLSNGAVDLVVTGTEVGGLPAHLLLQGFTGGRFSDDLIALPSAGDVREVALADLTGDGYVEILSVDGEGAITCYPSLGPAVFGEKTVFEPDGPVVQMLELARLGTKSLLAVRLEGGKAVILQAQAGCVLSELQSVASGAVLMKTADLDADGWSELMVLDTQAFLTLYDAVDGQTYEAVQFVELATTGVSDMGAGHVTGAEASDLVLAQPSGVVLLVDALNPDTLSPLDGFPLDDETGAVQIALGDLNGDGTDEVVATGGDAAPRIYGWRGGSVERVLFPDWHHDAISPVLADLDRDEDIDLVTLEPGFGAVIWSNDAAP